MNAVTPEFLTVIRASSDMELVMLQHDLRRYPEDRLFLDATLAELSDRHKRRAEPASVAAVLEDGDPPLVSTREKTSS